MIVYKKDGSEIDYGRTKRVYQYNKPEDALPSWLTVVGDVSVTNLDNFILERGALPSANLDTRLFLLSNIDALRFSLNNFRKSSNTTGMTFQLISEDEGTVLEYKTSNPSGTGVGLYLNDALVAAVEKFNFNGPLVNKPRKIGFHYNPLTGFTALLENNKVGHRFILPTKLDASKKYRFRVYFTTASITFSEVEIINWVSL